MRRNYHKEKELRCETGENGDLLSTPVSRAILFSGAPRGYKINCIMYDIYFLQYFRVSVIEMFRLFKIFLFKFNLSLFGTWKANINTNKRNYACYDSISELSYMVAVFGGYLKIMKISQSFFERVLFEIQRVMIVEYTDLIDEVKKYLEPKKEEVVKNDESE